MLVTPELSRQISEMLPGLQKSVREGIEDIGKMPVPEEISGLRTEIMLEVGDISLIIRKTKELMEA